MLTQQSTLYEGLVNHHTAPNSRVQIMIPSGGQFRRFHQHTMNMFVPLISASTRSHWDVLLDKACAIASVQPIVEQACMS